MTEMTSDFSAALNGAIERLDTLQVKGRYFTQRVLQDDFEVSGDILGTGCSGAVLAARSRHRPGRFAVKAYDLQYLDPGQKERLAGEVAVFLSLDHPHIARLFSVYESKDQLSLIMERMDGGELFERVCQTDRFSENDAAQATWHMLQSVSYIHSRGVVHRDLKLENFLYDAPGSDFLKLIDFGFSKFFPNDQKMREAMGTLAYVAPEVLRHRYARGSCDMWSLGVIVFILLSGEMPFHGRTDAETARKIKAGKYKLHWSRWYHISKRAKDFLEKLLVVCPKKRLDAVAALQHPWITSLAMAPAVPESVVTCFLNFAHATKFQRACLQAMAWSLTLEERRKLRGDFIHLSRQGVIKQQHLREFLSTQMQEDSEKLREALRALDILQNQTGDDISYSSFLAAMIACTKLEETSHAAKSAFRRFDHTDSGYLSPSKLREVLGEDFDVEVIFKEVDRDQDGKINIDEFLAHLNDVQSAAVERSLSSLSDGHALCACKSQKSKPHRFSRTVKAWFGALCGA